MNKRMVAAAASAVWGLTVGYTGTAFSQTAQGDSPATGAVAAAVPPAAQDDIETVVVTARRRSESLEKVPSSITALGAQQLADENIVTQSDLQLAVPGLTVRETQGSNSLTLSLRGQTVDAFTGSKTAVVPYFDEVQLSTGGASTYFDLDSIQVLKGPQGTLFGRNATGGAVLYTSTKPKDDLDGYFKFRIGDYNLHEEQAAVNIPLIDHSLLVRFAGDVIHQDGWQENIYNGQYLGETARQSGRLSILWRPIDKLENTLVTEIDHSGGNSTATRLHTVNRCGTVASDGTPLNCTADALYSPAVDSIFGAPGLWEAYVAAHPNLNPNGIAAYLDQTSPKIGFWKANEVAPVYHAEQDYFASNTTTYQLTPDLTLKNIVGASRLDARDLGSSVGAPYGVFYSANLVTGEFGNHTLQSDLSEELQLQGKALQDSLTYIVGAYYQYENADSLFPQLYFDFSPVLPGSSVDNHFLLKDKTPAVYAQSTYDLGAFGIKGLSFTSGFRYTWETVDIQQQPGSVTLLDASQPTNQSTRFSNPSWLLGMSYQASDALLVYAQGRRSWRSGGFNGTAPQYANIYKPEFTRDVEVGAKFAATVDTMPVRANLAVYNQWIDNVQRAEFPVPPGGQASIAYTVNVPEAEVTGVELDGTIKPFHWLETGLSGAATRARFVSGENEALVFGTKYIFGPYADAPRLSGSFHTTVFLPAPDSWGLMDVRTDLYDQTGQYFSNNNSTITPNSRIQGYGLVNMRYDWSQVLGTKFSVDAYVKNLTDKEYYTGGFALSASLGVNSVSVGTPRMFGVDLSYGF